MIKENSITIPTLIIVSLLSFVLGFGISNVIESFPSPSDICKLERFDGWTKQSFSDFIECYKIQNNTVITEWIQK